MERHLSSEELYHLVKAKKILEKIGGGMFQYFGALRACGYLSMTAYQNFHKEEKKRKQDEKERAKFHKERKELKEERDMPASRVDALELHSLVPEAAKWEFIENEDKKSDFSRIWTSI